MKETKIPKPKNKRLGISADEFRKEHDPQAKVLSALRSGRDRQGERAGQRR